MVMSGRTTVGHLVCRYPTGRIELGLDLLATHLFCDVGNPHPQHADRSWAVSSLVVDSQFDLIRFVNVHRKALVEPSIISGSFGSRFDCIFNLDDNVGLWSARES